MQLALIADAMRDWRDGLSHRRPERLLSPVVAPAAARCPACQRHLEPRQLRCPGCAQSFQGWASAD